MEIINYSSHDVNNKLLKIKLLQAGSLYWVVVKTGKLWQGACIKDPVLNPWAYISQSYKIGPIGGHLICSKKGLK